MNTHRWFYLVLACAALLPGCSSRKIADLPHRLEPADFAAADSRAPQAPPQTRHSTDKTSSPKESGPANTPTDRPAPTRKTQPPPKPGPTRPMNIRYTVDAMVGQVNGKPIYANTVFEPILEQLSVLGKSLPRSQFQLRAKQLIEGRLGQIIADALILGEAESDLSDQEHAGLQNILKQKREELIRFWGRGSVAVAEDNLVRQTSRSLEETLTSARQQMLVQRYLRQKLFPKINVTRKGVERYYNNHINEYMPPPGRTLRLIYVTQDANADADKIDQMFQRGVMFTEIASSDLNQYRPDAGGLMSQKAIGEEVFSQPQLNEAMLRLGVGEHSPRTRAGDRYWWIAVESIDQPPGKTLSEVQLEIEGLIRQRQFQTLTQRYRADLFQTGSYNPIETMSDSLIQIAINRFGAIE